ncbi:MULTISPECIES: helix-turn-helix transcriptional regulator [Mycobacterium ulcerans group]|nr:helix-turn-helix transcriptional regulator [Mycobacterium marinum]ACA50971.1 conserved hypothetical protein [Mycobacterium marinum DL240490]ACA57582.1 conserved hypothetical protein [Mycobacterium liflandii 128FXT]BDN85393.1 hypothetical protein NJB1907Z4_P0450 [Mycobacterium pseudoshottsii]GAQ32827.1 phosphopeptide-binding protein [Mycobacterium pseudoshottsii JCM 15466]
MRVSTATESPNERVGKAVADRRIEVGFETQRELAEAANVSLNTAALLERGKSFPHRANRIKFEDALGWPRGTLDAIRRGKPIPQSQPLPATQPGYAPPAPAPTDSRTNTQALAIATEVAAIAATSTQILIRHDNDPQARAVLRELDEQLLRLESLILTSLPHVAGVGPAFNETMAAATQLHEHREVIRGAASAAPNANTKPDGEPRTRLASARS